MEINSHEEQVEEMQQPQPAGEPGRDAKRRGRNTGIADEEFLHGRDLPQRLTHGHADHEQREDQRQGSKGIDPMPAESNLRHDTGLRRQPMVQTGPVVGGAERSLKRIMRAH
jgi:hypothetical protein